MLWCLPCASCLGGCAAWLATRCRGAQQECRSFTSCLSARGGRCKLLRAPMLALLTAAWLCTSASAAGLTSTTIRGMFGAAPAPAQQAAAAAAAASTTAARSTTTAAAAAALAQQQQAQQRGTSTAAAAAVMICHAAQLALAAAVRAAAAATAAAAAALLTLTAQQTRRSAGTR